MTERLTFLITIRASYSTYSPDIEHNFSLTFAPGDAGPEQETIDAFEHFLKPESQDILRRVIECSKAVDDFESYSIKKIEPIANSYVLWPRHFTKLEPDMGFCCPSPPCRSTYIRDDETTNTHVCQNCGCGWSRK